MLNLRREVFGDEATEAVTILKWAQRTADLSDIQLARRMGISARTVQDYRTGRRPRPGWMFTVRWLRACGFRILVDADGR